MACLCPFYLIVIRSIFVSVAEQKARTTYDNILRLVHDADICEPIRFLRAREIVHFQRFGEALRIAQDRMDSKNFYVMNPEFDTAVAKTDSCCD